MGHDDGRGHGSDERRRHGRGDGGGRGRDGGGGGGGGKMAFLDLEMSQVLYSVAKEETQHAYRELVRAALKEQLQKRFGAEIEAIAALAIEEKMLDIHTNLRIEREIQNHERARSELSRRISEVTRAPADGDPSDDN